MRGHLAFVLHAHLPFVRHPETPRFLEEVWLFEALAESYWPLVEAIERLERDGIPYGVTLSVSPSLGAMLDDALLHARYLTYLDERLEALSAETQRLGAAGAALVDFYVERYGGLRARARAAGVGGLLDTFARLARGGRLELITTGATHGYLPLLSAHGIDVAPQLRTAVRWFERRFGAAPRGLWLPECGYYPNVGSELARVGIGYTFVERHGLLLAEPRPKYGIHRPVRTRDGVAVFGRDFESATQVWSSIGGYPGHASYRDFYRDAAFDSDAPHLVRLRYAPNPSFSGLKYHAVGEGGAAKPLYDPARARAQVERDAEDFVARRFEQLAWLGSFFDAEPVITAPYDAELFGHWWFEGPLWLEAVFRHLASHDAALRATTASGYLATAGALQPVQVAESSWGEGGYHSVWLNPKTDWIYPRLAGAARALAELVSRAEGASMLVRRTLTQAGRELLLAEGSDWPFLLTRETSATYASRRIDMHLARLERLVEEARRGSVDAAYLGAVEAQDNLFVDLELGDFAGG